MKTAAQLVAEGYSGYAGWGDPEAWYDFLATGGAGKGGSSQQSSGGGGYDPIKFAEELVNSYKKEIEEETKWVDKYLADNPFVFDEELAKESATAEYSPYYTELLQDYLQDIDVQRQTTQDELGLLRNLRELDTQKRSRSYEYAVENVSEGYAGRGLFSSGLRARDIGRQEVEYQAGERGAEERFGTAEAGGERQLGVLETEEERKRRDIGRSEETAIAGGVEQRRGEKYRQYYTPLVTSYQRRFPTSSRGVSQYLPPDFLRY